MSTEIEIDLLQYLADASNPKIDGPNVENNQSSHMCDLLCRLGILCKPVDDGWEPIPEIPPGGGPPNPEPPGFFRTPKFCLEGFGENLPCTNALRRLRYRYHFLNSNRYDRRPCSSDRIPAQDIERDTLRDFFKFWDRQIPRTRENPEMDCNMLSSLILSCMDDPWFYDFNNCQFRLPQDLTNPDNGLVPIQRLPDCYPPEPYWLG